MEFSQSCEGIRRRLTKDASKHSSSVGAVDSPYAKSLLSYCGCFSKTKFSTEFPRLDRVTSTRFPRANVDMITNNAQFYPTIHKGIDYACPAMRMLTMSRKIIIGTPCSGQQNPLTVIRVANSCSSYSKNPTWGKSVNYDSLISQVAHIENSIGRHGTITSIKTLEYTKQVEECIRKVEKSRPMFQEVSDTNSHLEDKVKKWQQARRKFLLGTANMLRLIKLPIQV